MRFRRMVPCAAVMWGAFLSAPSPVSAQPSKVPLRDALEAGALARAAQLDRARGNTDAAIEKLTRASVLDPRPATLLALGSLLATSGRPLEGWDVVDRLAQRGEGSGGPPPKKLAALVAELEARTATLSVVLKPPTATVTLDGSDITGALRRGRVRILSGPHILKVTLRGYLPAEHSFSSAPMEVTALNVALEEVISTGLLRVVPPDERPYEVLVDGLAVGPAPLDLNATPGTFQVALRDASGSGVAVRATVAKGATVRVAPDAPEPPPKPLAAVGESCQDDESCVAPLLCEQGICVSAPPPRAQTATVGASCYELPCAAPARCIQDRCEISEPPHPLARVGVSGFLGTTLAQGGELRYPERPTYVGLAMTLPIATHVHYQLDLAYVSGGPVSGVRLTPFGIGFPFVAMRRGENLLAIEPGADLNVAYVGGDAPAGGLVSASLWGRVAYLRGGFRMFAEPLGIDRYLGAFTDKEASGATGQAYHLRFGAGAMF